MSGLLPEREHRETFWGDKNVLYLELNDGYRDVDICKSLLS